MSEKELPTKEDVEKAMAFTRERLMPLQRGSIEAFQNTGYCMTRGCPECDYFEAHTDDHAGTLREKIDLKKFQACHTIPRAAQLKAISDDKKEAIWIPMRPAEMWSKKPLWSRESIKRILTFRGFCNSCDNKLFGPIDGAFEEVDLNKAYLLAYRAFCYKAWRNEVDANGLMLGLTYAKEKAIADGVFEQAKFDEELQNVVRDQLRQKMTNIQMANIFQNGLEHQFYGRLKTRVFELDAKLDFRYSCAAPMTLDFLNRSLPINWGDCILDPIAFVSFLEVGGAPSLIVSWFDYIPNSISDKYVDVICEICDSEDFADVMVRYAVINNCGFAAHPNWVESWDGEMNAMMGLPIVQQVYQGKRPGEIELPTKRWFDQCSLRREYAVDDPNQDPSSMAQSYFEVAILDSEIEFEISEQDKAHLPSIWEKLLDENYSHLENNDPLSALRTAAEMTRIANRIGSSEIGIVLEAWKAMGTTLLHAGRPDLASSAYDIARRKYPAEHKPTGPYADLLARLAESFVRQGKISEAKTYSQESVDVHERLHQLEGEKRLPSLLNTLANLMNSCIGTRDYNACQSHGKRCLELTRGKETDYKEIVARIHNNFAVCYQAQGDLKSAFHVANTALKLYESLAEEDPENFLNEYEDFKTRVESLDLKMMLEQISPTGVSKHQLFFSSANDIKSARKARNKKLRKRSEKK